jgi:hypothetical protein
MENKATPKKTVFSLKTLQSNYLLLCDLISPNCEGLKKVNFAICNGLKRVYFSSLQWFIKGLFPSLPWL